MGKLEAYMATFHPSPSIEAIRFGHIHSPRYQTPPIETEVGFSARSIYSLWVLDWTCLMLFLGFGGMEMLKILIVHQLFPSG